MPLNKIKRLIRDSSGTASTPKPAIAHPSDVFPLVAKSQSMRNFVDECLNQARQGRYVAIAGHKDDLLEAPSLFLRLSDELGLSERLTMAQGREALDIKKAVVKGVGAVFLPTGRQIPMGVQHLLADERFPGFGLMAIIINIPPSECPQNVLHRELLARCGNLVLPWPSWEARQSDRRELVTNAAKLLGTGFGVQVTLQQDVAQAYAARPWKTVGHMVKAVHEAIVKSSTPNSATVNLPAPANIDRARVSERPFAVARPPSE